MTGHPLHLYNSLLRAQERFEPIDPENVRIYSCGPTVYHYAHLGNLRAYVFTDTLSRVLRWKGFPLTHIINITDVGHLTSDADTGEDKMEAASRDTGEDIWAVAARFTRAFKQDLRNLNIDDPARFPLATDHIADMIDYARSIETEHCYRLPDGLYFDTSTVPDYGMLARSVADQGESRITAAAGKRNPQDFAIWRTSAPGQNRQMEWASPWGPGAPGWHLECSVMSRRYLGTPFDIHTGGIDHREIHHPNEIAQNQAHEGCSHSGANIWLHNNFLVQRTGKMSKSSGDPLTLRTAIERGFHPLAYRLLCVQAHYRSELEFSWANLASAATRLKRLVRTVEGLRSKAPGDGRTGELDRLRERLDEAVSDDLNTPKVLPILDQWLGDGRLSPSERLTGLGEFDRILGLDLARLVLEDLRTRPFDAGLDEATAAALIEERRAARSVGDFARSDAIREELAAGGVELMDGDRLGWDWKPRSDD